MKWSTGLRLHLFLWTITRASTWPMQGLHAIQRWLSTCPQRFHFQGMLIMVAVATCCTILRILWLHSRMASSHVATPCMCKLWRRRG